MSAPARILIVENDAIARLSMREQLVELGYVVIGEAADCDGAVQIACEHCPDLALLDILIDGPRDGVTLARALRENNPECVIVFVTSHADPSSVRRAGLVRPEGYLVKPFGKDALFAAIETALAQRVQADSPEILERVAAEHAEGAALPAHLKQRLETFVDRRFNRNITLADLAAEAGLSPSHFGARFKATFDMTPMQYVIERRMAEAKRLLTQTNWSIREVADAVGFESQAYFATRFREVVGVAPREYRRV